MCTCPVGIGMKVVDNISDANYWIHPPSSKFEIDSAKSFRTVWLTQLIKLWKSGSDRQILLTLSNYGNEVGQEQILLGLCKMFLFSSILFLFELDRISIETTKETKQYIIIHVPFIIHHNMLFELHRISIKTTIETTWYICNQEQSSGWWIWCWVWRVWWWWSTLLYPVSLLSGCWDRWSSQKPKYHYRDHIVGQLQRGRRSQAETNAQKPKLWCLSVAAEMNNRFLWTLGSC